VVESLRRERNAERERDAHSQPQGDPVAAAVKAIRTIVYGLIWESAVKLLAETDRKDCQN
jgi:hypothetical protein